MSSKFITESEFVPLLKIYLKRIGAITGGGASAFTDLSDVPSSYTGASGKVVAVKSTEDALEFINAGGGGAFTDLSDVPSSYSGAGGMLVMVSLTEDGLEFIDGTMAFTYLTDVPAAYTGAAGKLVAVNATEDALEFITLAFSGLSDVPNSYSGAGGKIAAVKATEDGLEFVDAGEPVLGNPDADNFILHSSAAGVRSWKSPHETELTNVVSVELDYADAISYLNAAEPGREYRFVIPVGATGAWSGKDNQLAIYKSSTWRYETPVDYQQVLAIGYTGTESARHIYCYTAYSDTWSRIDPAVTESAFVFANNTTGDASPSMHGLCPKLSGVATQVFCGDGSWMAMAGAVGLVKVYSKPSANIRNTNAAAVATHEITDVLLKAWVLGEPVKGVRLSFLLRSSESGYVAQAQIRRNGVNIGTLRQVTTVAGATFTEDFSTDLWGAGDVIQLYGSIDDASKSCTVSAFNFLYDRAIAGFGPWNIAAVADYFTTAEQTAYDMTANS